MTLRFRVDPRDVPPEVAARRLGVLCGNDGAESEELTIDPTHSIHLGSREGG